MALLTPPSAPSLYPAPSDTALKLHYVGKHVSEIPAPAAVLDVAAIRRNCKYMLETVKALGIGFRAHVKTHKTTQLTKLQVGDETPDIRLVVSTVAEVEHLVPWLLECQAAGRKVNVLYGVPIAPSHIPRLAAVARLLGPGCLGLFIDHPAQVENLGAIDQNVWPGQIPVFIKIDTGYHRAGLSPGSATLDRLVESVIAHPRVRIKGTYAHHGHSYASSSPPEALKYLRDEIEGVRAGAAHVVKALPASHGKLTLSVGASPTATSVQNILGDGPEATEWRGYLAGVKEDYDLELHAGVYPVLDMQQLAARARPAVQGSTPTLDFSNLALRIMVEVASVYEDRDKPEALICAGSIVLGREPCKSYSGWGVVTSWTAGRQKSDSPHYDPEGDKTGWTVGRISQEHGILTWEGSTSKLRSLSVGEKVMIWPNHACMAGPSFGWYLVVDSDAEDPERVVDVWVRWRGW